MMSFPNLDQVLSVVIALAPVLSIVVPFLYQLLLSKLPAKQRDELSQLVQAGVQMAEQAGSGQTGAQKKQMAVDAINQAAKAAGVKVDPVLVNMLIEAAVYMMNQNQPPASPPVGGAFKAN
jgi:LL-H family phage holin